MSKVWRRGVPFDAAVAPLVSRMTLVDEYRETLLRLHGTWDTLALLGEMSGTMAEIAQTRESFQALSHVLLDSLARQQLRDVTQRLQGTAQVAIDVLVRNLFERTADVGFLATDHAVRALVADPAGSDRDVLEARFAAYVAKYSVYDDVVVLDRAGSVLARLDRQARSVRCSEPWVGDALRPGVPHVERFGPSELLDDRRGLLYAAAVAGPDGRPAGVLCLSFRFDDEMARLFARLAGDHAGTIGLVDGQGRVTASADPWQLPVGMEVPAVRAGHATLRLAGRDYLVARAPATGFQGYGGPGWEGLAVVPVEVAFGDGPDDTHMAHAAVTRTLDTRDIFDHELREIPLQAAAIQRTLAQSVWNGRLQLGRHAGLPGGNALAAALLKEVSATADRIRDVFHDAVSRLQAAAMVSILDHARFQAGLAIEMVDRNLYERANDCRWWALAADLQHALAEPSAVANAARMLTRLNGLYPVYSQVVLFDAAGRALATSDPGRADLAGRPVDAALVRATLAMQGPEDWHVTPHGPDAFGEGVPTLVYSAAMAGGGIALVFDGATQFSAMLADAVPRSPGAVGLLLTRHGQVVASTHPRFSVGSVAPLPSGMLQGGRGESRNDLVELDGVWFAIGVAHSGGYREYRSAGEPGPDDLLAVVLLRLGEALVPASSGLERFQPRRAVAPKPADAVDLATFALDGAWYALPASEVVEALAGRHVTPVPHARPHVLGFVGWRDETLVAIDLAAWRSGAAATHRDGPLLVCETAPGRHLALRVDHLGDVLSVDPTALHPWASPGDGTPLQLLAGHSGSMLTVLSLRALSVAGADLPAAAATADLRPLVTPVFHGVGV